MRRATVFRLVATLQANGLVVKGPDRKYRLAGGILPGHKYKIGYIAETGEPPVTELQARALKFIKAFTKTTGVSKVDAPGLAGPAVTEEDVREFIAFLKSCGGFTIM